LQALNKSRIGHIASVTDIAVDVVPGKQKDLGLVSHDCIPDRLRLLLIGTGAESNPH
jgi:hypothetical protein